MPTAEEVLAQRFVAEQDAQVARMKAFAERRAAELESARQRFTASIEAAAARLEATGFVGGLLKMRWQRRYQTKPVAVWLLRVQLPSYDMGLYFFAPSSREVVVQVICGDEERRQHSKVVTNQRLRPEWHHAAREDWLMGLHRDPSAELLNSLSDGLDMLAAD